LQLIYFALLARAYGRAEMSLIFPLARGLAPVLVLLVGVLALHVRASPGELAGVLLVAIGAVAVRGIRLAGGFADTGIALELRPRAAVVLRERVGPARFCGACLVAAGVTVLALAADP
jgi:uncharacterized membrane protein